MSEQTQSTESAIATVSYLLGMSMAALFSVQGHLIQGENKEALSIINEAVRVLSDKVDKCMYAKPVSAEVANVSA